MKKRGEHRIVERIYDPKPGTDRLLDALRFLYEDSLAREAAERHYCDYTPDGGDYGNDSCCQPATFRDEDDWYCAEHARPSRARGADR